MSQVFMASDHAGFALKNLLVAYVHRMGHAVIDLGCDSEAACDYPDFAQLAVGHVLKEGHFGILICGSGVGMAIAANRHPGIRAVVCHETFSATMSRRHNDANVLCMGSRIVGVGVAEAVILAFLGAAFEGGRHGQRLAKIDR